LKLWKAYVRYTSKITKEAIAICKDMGRGQQIPKVAFAIVQLQWTEERRRRGPFSTDCFVRALPSSRPASPAELGVAAFIGKRIAGGRAVERALVVEAFSSTQQDRISMPWSHATLNFWFIFFSLVAKFWFSFYHAA